MEENNYPPAGGLNTPPVESSPMEQNNIPPVQKPKLKLPIIIAGIVLFLILIGTASAAYLLMNKNAGPVACTMEAKICPDGTSVGRGGPNCEFSACPTNSNPSPTSDPTASWKTYTDSGLNYSFQYPPTTCELQRILGDTSLVLCYLPKGSDGGPKKNNGYVVSLGFISESQLNVMGITYCGAYPNDSPRCESLKIGNVDASIDWGTGADTNASAWISRPSGGIVTFNLQPVTSESKEILKQILSTFRFD